MEQHLGNYHQSVPALSGDELFCTMFQTVWKAFCADSREYKFHSHFSFTLIYSISLFFPHPPLSLFFFWQDYCMPLLFISLHFRGMNCSPLSLGSGQEFIFSRSNVSECHLWQEPTSTMNTRKDTACWFFFFFLFDHCIHLKHGNHAVHKAEAQAQECLCRNQYWIKTLPTHE